MQIILHWGLYMGPALFSKAHEPNKSLGAKVVYIVSLIWVVVKIMVPFWLTIIIRHLTFRVPKKGP